MTILDYECEDVADDKDKIWWKLGCQAHQENSAASLCKYSNRKLLPSNKSITKYCRIFASLRV